VEVPIQKENEAPLGQDSKGERGGEWGGSIPTSSDCGVWESVVSSPSTEINAKAGVFGPRPRPRPNVTGIKITK